MSGFFTEDQRRLQGKFGTRRLADAQERGIVHEHLTEEDRAFITSRDMLFLSTVDAGGQPTVSYKGGAVGFVRIDGDHLLLPCYDGNGMFLSMGNVASVARVGLLFIDFETPRRLRLHGIAQIEPEDAVQHPGAGKRMRIRPTSIFVNCPRYVHTYRKIEISRYVPDAAGTAPIAEWKRLAFLQDDLPEADRDRALAEGLISQEAYDAMVARGLG